MAEGTETSLSWPLPPMQYIKNYTNENVKNGMAPAPPPPMVSETYSMFGCPFHPHDTIIQSLESQNVKRLYPPNYDQKKELRKMNHSLLANFLDLLDILVKSPDSEMRNDKVEDIRLLFINMHHLVNEYRAHQARETIRVLLSVQKKQRLEIADRFQRQLDRITESLHQSLSSLHRPALPLKFKAEPMDIAEAGQLDSQSNEETPVPDSRDSLMSQMLANT